MKNLRLPSSCAFLSEEEQRIVSGGGEFKDAVNEFLDHLHLQDLILGRGLISFSISFVPMMLFTVVKTGFNVAVKIYDFCCPPRCWPPAFPPRRPSRIWWTTIPLTSIDPRRFSFA